MRKNKISNPIELACTNCGVVIIRPMTEFRRSKKYGTNLFCSYECNASFNGKKSGAKQLLKYAGANKMHDRYIAYRDHVGKARRRHSKKSCKLEFDIDLMYLEKLWHFQKGKCALTGLPLYHKLPKTRSRDIGMASAASLDRIDSSKWYTKDNVQFVCMGMNFAKSNYSDEEAREFVRLIRYGNEGYDYFKSEIVEKLEQLIPC